MEGRVIIFLLVCICGLLVLLTLNLFLVSDELRVLSRLIMDIIEQDAKTIERNAEDALAEEYEDGEPSLLADALNNSLYLTKDNKYSYKVYAENKRKQEKKKNPEDYIDDFEEAAVKAERNKYGR